MTLGKVLALDDVARRLEAMRREGRRVVVHCHGCFDLMHLEHIRHLQAARAMGDMLVVTVTADTHVDKGDGRPAFTEHERAEALAALACVDFVSINREPTAVGAICLLRPATSRARSPRILSAAARGYGWRSRPCAPWVAKRASPTRWCSRPPRS